MTGETLVFLTERVTPAGEDMNRGTRRDRTARIVAQRRALHLRFDHGPRMMVLALLGRYHCTCCEKGTHFWATNRPGSCHCTKRAHGQPRVFGGMCCGGDRSRIYQGRKQVLELNRLMAMGWEGDDDTMALLESRRER